MKIILDRIDLDGNGSKIATFEVDERFIAFSHMQVPDGFFDSLIPNAIVECEIIDGKIVNPVVLVEETKEAEEKMRRRLNGLFKRKDK
jgi:hypothetical protein